MIFSSHKDTHLLLIFSLHFLMAKAPQVRGFVLHLFCELNVNYMNDINHPIKSLELQQNFKADTGFDWKTNLMEYLIYINSYVVRENAAVIMREISQVREELRLIKEGVTKK